MGNQNRFTTQTRRIRKNNTFIILAAGAGRGMACYGPKCLLTYQNETVLDYQIKTIRNFDLNAEIIVVAGFHARRIIGKMDHRIRIIENVRYDETNSVESLRLALNACIPGNVYVIHGDIIFSPAALSPKKEECWVFVDDCGRIPKTEVGAVSVDGSVTNLSYGLKQGWGQIAYITYEHFEEAKKILSIIDKNSSTFEFINKMIKRGVKFVPYKNNKCVLKEIGSIKDLE